MSEPAPKVPEESLEELYENAPCGYVTTLPDGTFARCNDTFLALTHYTREELLGRKRLPEILTMPGRIYFETHLWPLLRMQSFVRDVSLDLVRKDGKRVPVVMHATVQRDAAGEPVSIRTTLFDATDRRRYERELLEARRRAERLAAVVEVSQDAIVTMKPDGTVETWNGGAERLFGHTLAEAIGRRARDLLVPPSRYAEHDEHLRILASGRDIYRETVLLHKSGQPVEVSVRATPHMGALREIEAISAIIRDIGEQRRLEAKLRRAEQLESLGTLAGGVAHEVNNQMTVVLGFAELVVRALGRGHPQSRDIDRMIAAAARAARVSQQLLAFGRRQHLAPVALDLHERVSVLLGELRRILGPTRSLVLLPPRGAVRALADPSRVEQVLVSLVANARDATDAGGRVTIAVEAATLTDADAEAHPTDDVVPGAYVRLAVTDDGHGMDDVTLARVFEPFFTTREIASGSGLGLPSTLGVVKQHGGQIWIHSARERGTTVDVYFPAAAPEESAAEPSAAHSRPISGRAVVLVVEDEPSLRALARRVLEDAGFGVIEAEDGVRAVEQLEAAAQPPHLVLTDIVMPQMNGRELGDVVRRRWPAVQVLYMSGYPAEEMRSRNLLAIDAAFIQKPFSPADLVARVLELVAPP